MQAQTYLRKTRWGPHHHHACTKAVTHSIGSQHPRARAVGRFPVVPKRAAPACSTCDTAVSNNAGRLPLTHSLPCCIKLPLPMHTHTHTPDQCTMQHSASITLSMQHDETLNGLHSCRMPHAHALNHRRHATYTHPSQTNRLILTKRVPPVTAHVRHTLDSNMRLWTVMPSTQTLMPDHTRAKPSTAY